MDLNKAILYDSNRYTYYKDRAMVHEKRGDLSKSINDLTIAINLCKKADTSSWMTLDFILTEYYGNRSILYIKTKDFYSA